MRSDEDMELGEIERKVARSTTRLAVEFAKRVGVFEESDLPIFYAVFPQTVADWFDRIRQRNLQTTALIVCEQMSKPKKDS